MRLRRTGFVVLAPDDSAEKIIGDAKATFRISGGAHEGVRPLVGFVRLRRTGFVVLAPDDSAEKVIGDAKATFRIWGSS